MKLIYIDPPHNMGNDFVYNDDFAEDADNDYFQLITAPAARDIGVPKRPKLLMITSRHAQNR